VEVPYRVNATLPTPVFGIAIHRNDGILVYASNTDVDAVEIGPLTADGIVRLTYPDIQMLPGTYRVTVAVLPSPRYGEPTIDTHWQRYAFRVRGGGPVAEQGVTRLPHHWQHIEPGTITRPENGAWSNGAEERAG